MVHVPAYTCTLAVSKSFSTSFVNKHYTILY